MKIGLIPLDERPANTRYPVMIGEIAGVEVLVPPPETLSHFRTPADSAALQAWLHDTAQSLDALIVSCEMLGYGGLIASRISHEPAEIILARFDILQSLKRQRPTLPILGFNVITRISRHNDATEEPPYWAEHGTALFRLSQWMDQAGRGEPVERDLAALRAVIPSQHIDDFLRRRARNHQINRAVLRLTAEGVFDQLVLSSDDTSEYGLGTVEKRTLQDEAARLNLGERLLMYPGADEVGGVLLARLLNAHYGTAPRFWPAYMVPGGEKITAPFEDGPVAVTVERQLRAAGAVIASDPGSADVLLFVNPPLAPDADWVRDYTPGERAARLPHLAQAVNQIAELLRAGKRAAVADVAHANGADKPLFDLLREQIDLSALTAYAAWNTAGNTLGTVIAQSCAVLFARGDDQRAAQQRFLAHRVIEDWAYQSIIRQDVRSYLEAATGEREPSAHNLNEVQAWIEANMSDLIPTPLRRWRIKPGSLCLPWSRTFEVDFDLESGE